MNSENSFLEATAAKWQDLPGAEAVESAARQLCEEYRPASRSTREFNRLISAATRALARAGNRSVPKGPAALGFGISLLTPMGSPDDFLFAFTEGDAEAPKRVIVTLKDSLLAQMQLDHRRYLLTTCYPDWASRQRLADQWRESQSPDVRARHQGWELTDCIDDILDSVGAGERLLKQLGHVSPPSKSTSGAVKQEAAIQKTP